jgi:hypothetical protein
LNKSPFIRGTEKLSGFCRPAIADCGVGGVDPLLWSPTGIARTRESVLPFASDLPAYLLDDLIHRTKLPAVFLFDVAICFTHPKPFHDYYRPVHHLHSVPASSTRWIQFTILDGDFSPNVIPRESTRAALALHFQFSQRKNGMPEFLAEKAGNLGHGVKKVWRFHPRLAVSGRVNAHAPLHYRLVAVKEFKRSSVSAVIKTISYSHL